MIFHSYRRGDGCWYVPTEFDVQNLLRVDGAALKLALFQPHERTTATAEDCRRRFMAQVAAMDNESFLFVLHAYLKADSGRQDEMCFAERMALARVCRRIIREAKEKESE